MDATYTQHHLGLAWYWSAEPTRNIKPLQKATFHFGDHEWRQEVHPRILPAGISFARKLYRKGN